MRFLFGIVLGVLLTVSAAYVRDSMYAVPSGGGVGPRPVVNWDVAAEVVRNGSAVVREQIGRLTGG